MENELTNYYVAYEYDGRKGWCWLRAHNDEEARGRAMKVWEAGPLAGAEKDRVAVHIVRQRAKKEL